MKRSTATPTNPPGLEDIDRRCEEMLAIVSHDLRAPLLTIRTCAHALQHDAHDVHQLAAMIDEAAGWSTRLIKDLLDITSIRTGRIQLHRGPTSAYALLDLVQAIFVPVAAAGGVALLVTAPTRDVPLHIDADRILQALGNLVSNAVRASERGGVVHVDMRLQPRFAIVRVTDHGRGIAPARMAALFDGRAMRTDPERDGSGLGLAIAQGIIEAHGGRVSAQSEIGRGSTFSCQLPRSTEAQESAR